MPATGFAESIGDVQSGLQLPDSVDFREACGPVRDQGEEGACTGFALTGMLQGLRAKSGLPFVELSPSFVYFEERKIEDATGLDAGANPEDGLRVLERIGCPPERDDAYVPGNVSAPPSIQAIDHADRQRIATWWPVRRLRGDAAAAVAPIRALLAGGTPVNAAVLVHSSFATAPGGSVPIPAGDAEDPVLGGHDIVLVGYRQDSALPGGGGFIFRNSWGTSWGDGGHGVLPYSYVADPALTPGLWAAALPAPAATTRVAVLVSGRQVTEGTIVNGVTIAALRPVVQALGATIEYSDGAVRITPKAGEGPLFGVDSAAPVSKEAYAQVRHWASVSIGFWGRYLGTGGGAAVPLSASEVQVLHDIGVGIVPIYNDVVQTALGTAIEGEAAGRDAVLKARALGIPQGVAVFADIEAGWPVTGAWLQGWAQELAAENYRPGVYVNLADPHATTALKTLLSQNPTLYHRLIVWNARWLATGGWDVFNNGRISTPPFTAPQGYQDVVGLWQFAGASDGGFVDLNLRNPAILSLSYVWR